MPLDRVDQLPLPNLHLYAFFSGLVLFYALVYGLSSPDGLTATFMADVWCAAVSIKPQVITCDIIKSIALTVP